MNCYQIKNNVLAETESALTQGVICVCTPEELRAQQHGFAPHTVEECGQSGPAKLEPYDGYDFILLNLIDEKLLNATYRLGLYVTADNLVFVCERKSKILCDVLEMFSEASAAKLSFARIIYAFFDHLTTEDSQHLEQVEDEISALEDRILESKDGNYVREITAIRKRIMFYKKYYEQLLDVAESIEENENELLSPSALRYFRMFTARADRLNRHVLNLRDYVTQVRESYQSQVDIRLNEIMKLFTVVTVIFLPLTLLVGWYGMNFQNMPELQWPYGYAMAIILSLLFVIVSVIYFKKKKIL